MGVLGPAEASLTTSQLAVERATNKDAHEFAGFELGEAITVNEVLKDLGTKSALDTNATAAIAKIKGADEGRGLRPGLHRVPARQPRVPAGSRGRLPAQQRGRDRSHGEAGAPARLLMLAVFKEHVAICKRVNAELKA